MPEKQSINFGKGTAAIVFAALVLPALIGLSILSYFYYYVQIAEQYDCYPLENCQFDFDGDGTVDRINLVDESIPNKRIHVRLKLFVKLEGSEREALNLEYVGVDNSYRTHLAFLEEGSQRKVVIYDTKNEHQFFIWNGNEFQPSNNPSEKEKSIRKAMWFRDDTGGHHGQVLVVVAYAGIAVLYYVLLFSIIIYLIFSRRRRLNLR